MGGVRNRARAGTGREMRRRGGAVRRGDRWMMAGAGGTRAETRANAETDEAISYALIRFVVKPRRSRNKKRRSSPRVARSNASSTTVVS